MDEELEESARIQAAAAKDGYWCGIYKPLQILITMLWESTIARA